jgi:cation transport ATPase
MTNLNDRDRRLMQATLVITWLATAAISVIEWNGQSRSVLQQAGITQRGMADALIALGIAVDLAVGLALWLRPGRNVYLGALLAMAAMTVTGTLIQPRLWLDPLGPLLKNLPIAAMLWVLARR